MKRWFMRKSPSNKCDAFKWIEKQGRVEIFVILFCGSHFDSDSCAGNEKSEHSRF